MAVAKTIADTLLEELNVYSVSGETPDPFTSSRLRREIKKLESTHFISARICLGILFTIEKNSKNAISTFEEIARYEPKDPNIHLSYAHSLSAFKMKVLACHHYKLAAQLMPNSIESLLGLAETARDIFKPREFTSTLNSCDPDFVENLLNHPEAHQAFLMASLFETNRVSDEDANKIYSIAQEILQSNNIFFEQGNIKQTDIYGGPTVTFYSGLAQSDDLIFTLNEQLCDRIVDADAAHILKHVTYVFVSH